MEPQFTFKSGISEQLLERYKQFAGKTCRDNNLIGSKDYVKLQIDVILYSWAYSKISSTKKGIDIKKPVT